MKRGAIAALLLLLWALPARANFWTYPEWQALPTELRAAYIAGAFDTFTTIQGSTGDKVMPEVAAHYAQCIESAHMNALQLADNVTKFVATKPELQTSTVPIALVKYLYAACGPLR
jgi:hypothetical protein